MRTPLIRGELKMFIDVFLSALKKVRVTGTRANRLLHGGKLRAKLSRRTFEI